MSLVRLKEKGQVTIPAAVREAISAVQGDVFEVTVINGNVVLKPLEVVSRARSRETLAKKAIDISQWIASGSGSFKSPDEVDAFIRSERAQWE